MAVSSFDFEKPIVDLEEKIQKLREVEHPTEEQRARLETLQQDLEKTRHEVYDNLTPWQRVQFARHLARPHALDYVRMIFTDWAELAGDRLFGDDHACVAGFARLDGRPVAVIGQQKGKDVRENAFRNYGSMHPEGYRKALRVMRLAEKFERPIFTLIDTQGAYPGVGAEERGQAEAIARNIMEMFALKTPIIVTVIGEGGSGGALGIGVGDRVLMLENAYYSLISPEGCASILWRDAKFSPDAAKNLKLTSSDLLELGVIDEVVKEPMGGAHRDPATTGANLKEALVRNLGELDKLDGDELLEERFQKYREMGVWTEA